MSMRNEGIVRCAWCGTAESEKWLPSTSPKLFYCSRDCYRAKTDFRGDMREVREQSIVGGIVSGLLAGSVVILYSQFPPVGAFVILVITAILTTLVFYACQVGSAAQVKAYKKRVPPGSRHKMYIDQDELSDVVAAITCPVCNADLDPSKRNHKDTYHCEFCGANVKLPDWTR